MPADDLHSALPRIGETVRGKYAIVRPLGEGGMAYVFEASRVVDGQRVAVKLLSPALAHDKDLVARFEREARAVSKLRTQNVARVIDVGVSERGLPFIVMELLVGRDLEAELEARRALPVAEAVDLVLQACAAMHDAHAVNIVHRDLKPANLFLHVDGGRRIVKVLDFGISKILGEASKLTGAGAVMGTVIYMPPEQIRAAVAVDARADIWSLGVILFELLAGRAPFEGPPYKVAAEIVTKNAPDVRELVPDAPAGLARVIARMLERDAKARFSTVREVVAALAPFAPPGSLGATAAESIAAGRSSERGATPAAIASHRQQKTVPLLHVGSVPPPPPAPSSRASLPTAAPSVLPLPPPPTTPPITRSSGGARVAVLVGVIVGLAGAGLFIALRLMHAARRDATTGATSPDVSASAAPPPSTAVAIPPPPTTGTTSVASPEASTDGPRLPREGRMSDGGTRPQAAAGSATASSGRAPHANPPHL